MRYKPSHLDGARPRPCLYCTPRPQAEKSIYRTAVETVSATAEDLKARAAALRCAGLLADARPSPLCPKPRVVAPLMPCPASLPLLQAVLARVQADIEAGEEHSDTDHPWVRWGTGACGAVARCSLLAS